jgi:regulator of replication initiation timing
METFNNKKKSSICEYCQEAQTKKLRHENKCTVKKLLKNCNKPFIDLLQKHHFFKQEHVKEIIEENSRLKIENEDLKKELKHTIKTEEEMNTELEYLERNTTKQKVERIMNTIGENEREKSKREYDNFRKWSKKENKNLTHVTDVANEYMKSLKPNSTLPKKRKALQKAIRIHHNTDVARITPTQWASKEKFCFTNQELLFEYLKEQCLRNYHKYIIQTFMVKFGLRINSMYHLKWKHFERLDRNNVIVFHDSKDNKNYAGIVSKKFKEFIGHYLITYKARDSEGYVFYSGITNLKKRRQTMTKLIDRCFIKSEVLKKERESGLGFSSHCLRKTRCFMDYEEGHKFLMNECGFSIGHSKNSKVTKVYTTVTEKLIRPEFEIPLFFPRGKVYDFVISPRCPECNAEIVCECLKDKTREIHKLLNEIAGGVKVKDVEYEFGEMICHELEDARFLTNSLLEALAIQNLVFSEELIGGPVEINEVIQGMSKNNIEIINNMKFKWERMIYGPMKILYDDSLGHYVVATKEIKRGVLVCEYIGDIVRHDETTNVCDSVMEYTGDYVIAPLRHANIAKFFSGVNTYKKHLPNMASIRCVIDGMVHVYLYTIRDINPNEVMCYDYNGGILSEYDTRKFKNLNKHLGKKRNRFKVNK